MPTHDVLLNFTFQGKQLKSRSGTVRSKGVTTYEFHTVVTPSGAIRRWEMDRQGRDIRIQADIPKSLSEEQRFRKLFYLAAKTIPQERSGNKSLLLSEEDARKLCAKADSLIRKEGCSRTAAKNRVAIGSGCSRRTLERAMNKWKIKLKATPPKRPCTTTLPAPITKTSSPSVREFKPNAAGSFDDVSQRSPL
jgi:hypothetical protein